MTPPDPIDCLVIGAGPAGLATAIYLARFRRRFEVIDDGNSRAAWIPVSHNLAGFTNGISGKNLLSRMRSHAKKYGAAITRGSIVKLAKETGGWFVATGADGRVIRASTVMLATGVIDDEPALPQLRQAVRRGLIRHRRICDGYEVIDNKVGVIGSITISEARWTVSLWPATSPAAWIRSSSRWGKRPSPPPQSTTG